MSAPLIAVALILFVLGIVAAVLVPKYFSLKAVETHWYPLPNHTGAMVFLSPTLREKFSTVTPAMVDARVSYALASLAQFGPWSRLALEMYVPDLRIIVNPSSDWVDTSLQRVAGQTYFTTVAVDAALKSLAHEMVHVFEFVLEGHVDGTHARWEERGFYRAIDDYEKKL